MDAVAGPNCLKDVNAKRYLCHDVAVRVRPRVALWVSDACVVNSLNGSGSAASRATRVSGDLVSDFHVVDCSVSFCAVVSSVFSSNVRPCDIKFSFVLPSFSAGFRDVRTVQFRSIHDYLAAVEDCFHPNYYPYVPAIY